MKLHRFIGDYTITPGKIKITDRDVVNQISHVLRLKTGEQIMLCDGAMNEALATIVGFGKDAVDVEIVKTMKNENEPAAKVTLYCSILKRENFELIVQKATEVGVTKIIPLICKRTVKLDLKKERLEKIIKEAAEQSGRGVVPTLHEPVQCEEAVKQTEGKMNLFFDASGSPLSSTQKLENVGIWIGPEGGWDQEEVKMAHNANFTIVSLGKLTLRAETAAIVASYLGVAFNQFS